MMRIDVVTTFPEMFAAEAPGVLGVSIPARAIRAGALSVHATDIRAYAANKHAKTDDRPFGGGPGMVMSCQPLWDCVMAVEGMDAAPARRVLLSPQGVGLTQELVEALAREQRLLMIAGHYEGIDERVIEALQPLEVSLGDFVLSGGELGALVMIDAIARLLPGVLGDELSNQQDSFSSVTWKVGKKETRTQRLLDCPHYTKPREWMGRGVPEVLLSGDHGRIEAWRLEQRLARTKARRPDLMGEG